MYLDHSYKYCRLHVQMLLYQTAVKALSLMPSLLTRKETLSSSKVWNSCGLYFLLELMSLSITVTGFPPKHQG